MKQCVFYGQPASKKTKRLLSANKVLAKVFWVAFNIILADYPVKGNTINTVYYINLGDSFNDFVKETRTHLSKKKISLIKIKSLIKTMYECIVLLKVLINNYININQSINQINQCRNKLCHCHGKILCIII